MRYKNALFILTNGRVAAIDRKNGEIIWEVKLKTHLGHSVGYNVGQIMVADDKLYVGISGYLVCMRAKDGSLVWKNELKGWGLQFISMANAGNEAAASAIQQAAAASAAVSSGSSGGY